MNEQSICILGGSGFVGSQLAHRLTQSGYRVVIPTRRRDRHRALLVDPRVHLVETRISSAEAMEPLFQGCTAVINMVGILNENGAKFAEAHVEMTRNMVAAAKATGVNRILHMSALNAYPREEHSIYLRTKGEAEDIVHAAAEDGIQVTSFRPSVIFGPGDSFFNRFATLLRMTPFAFPLACPDTRFAPVYIGDVVSAFEYALAHPETAGAHYDLCGPSSYSLRELVDYTAAQLGLDRHVIGLGKGMSQMQARILGLLPGKPFSMDNYWSLQKDSLCHDNALEGLGITPTSVESVVPQYVGKAYRGARLQQYRRGAHRA